MSEIDTRSNGVVALSDEFTTNFPALDPEQNIMALLAENLSGDAESDVALTLGDFPRIKVPAGGSTSWEIPDPEGGDNTSSTKELEGVIVYQTGRRSYWPTSNPTGEPPSCRSVDLKIGEGTFGPGSDANPTGACASCPMSQRGSGKSEANPNTNASACKEQKLVFLLPKGEMLPYMITVPPGSLQGYRKFGIAVSLAKRKIYAQSTKLKLTKATNDGGQDYSQIAFASGDVLAPEEVVAVKEYGASLGAMVQANMTAVADLVDGVADAGPAAVDMDGETVDYESEIPDDDVMVGDTSTASTAAGR